MNTENNDSLGFRSGSGYGSETQPRGATEESLGDQMKAKAREVAGDAKEKTGDQITSTLTKGKSRTAETLSGVAESLRQSGQHLRGQDHARAGGYVDKAADRLEGAASYLMNTDVSEIVDQVEDFARREPALFIGGAFALGLLGARFITNSRRRETEKSGQGSYEMNRGGRARKLEREVTTPRQFAADTLRDRPSTYGDTERSWGSPGTFGEANR
ncbi:MAG: hypothetical protein ABR543_06210 [Gemmatimonadaceae bacterium]